MYINGQEAPVSSVVEHSSSQGQEAKTRTDHFKYSKWYFMLVTLDNLRLPCVPLTTCPFMRARLAGESHSKTW